MLLVLGAGCAGPDDGGPPDDDAATVAIHFVAEGATGGEVVLVEEVDPQDVLRGVTPFTLGPVALDETVHADLPVGWLTLVAEGELTPHPGCSGTEFEDGWRAQHEVWVGVDDPPAGRPRHVVHGGAVERLEFELQPTCGCCLD